LRFSLCGRRFCSLGSRCGGLALCRRLRAEFLRKALDATLGVDQLLATREERVARRADFEVQFGLGRTRLERVAARAANFDLLVLWMNPCLHGVLPFDSLRSLRASDPFACPSTRVRSLGADCGKGRKGFIIYTSSLRAGLQRDPALQRRHHRRRRDEIRFHRGSELSLILPSEVWRAPGARDLRIEHHASLTLWQFQRLSVNRRVSADTIDDRL